MKFREKKEAVEKCARMAVYTGLGLFVVWVAGMALLLFLGLNSDSNVAIFSVIAGFLWWVVFRRYARIVVNCEQCDFDLVNVITVSEFSERCKIKRNI